MRNQEREEAAVDAANYLRNKLNLTQAMSTAIVLGTGWGDALMLEDSREVRFEEIPGFGRLQNIIGHARRVVCGKLHGREVLLLRGRVHLNEAPNDHNLSKQVRLQIEMLFHLGITKLVLTCAAGGLVDSTIRAGDLVIINDFVSLFAPPMPLWAGEFCSPKDALSSKLQKLAKIAGEHFPEKVHVGAYAMVRGPQFEGPLDKQLIINSGAVIVGMSTYPEVCVASLYPAVQALAMAFVSNDSAEHHNHETNVHRAKDQAVYLGRFLEELVKQF